MDLVSFFLDEGSRESEPKQFVENRYFTVDPPPTPPLRSVFREFFWWVQKTYFFGSKKTVLSPYEFSVGQNVHICSREFVKKHIISVLLTACSATKWSHSGIAGALKT